MRRDGVESRLLIGSVEFGSGAAREDAGPSPSSRVRGVEMATAAATVARPLGASTVPVGRDAHWLEQLYNDHCDLVYRYAHALVNEGTTAEDIVAEVFLRAWRYRHALRDDGRSAAWLLAITRRVAIDAFRRTARYGQSESPLEDRPELAAPVTADPPEDEGCIWSAFRKLTRGQQQVLYLRFVEERSHEEVLRMLGRSPGAIRAVQFRALARMRRLLEGCDVG